MAKRSQTGASDATSNAGAPQATGLDGMPPDLVSGGMPLAPPASSAPPGLSDIDWHDAAAAIASRHWRRTLWLVAVLMVIGFGVTFVPQFWAREWAAMRFGGWPLPFYMGAQGAILIDIVLIVVYASMQRLNDARYHKALHALRDARRDSLRLDGDEQQSAMTSAASPSASSRAASAQTYQ
ncbi:DUF4212 domain-containing protein [Pandoraea sp. NPDC087047]|uniref:DUF4212 domain-containing protein n=1 Tax=Pandoraea sp. NPDC087047 TaxID=3364390 RepID=UPI003828387B